MVNGLFVFVVINDYLKYDSVTRGLSDSNRCEGNVFNKNKSFREEA